MTRAAWDVIIVGAGPAGAALACKLAPTRRVLLLERKREVAPRIGESLPGAARVLLAELGVLEAFLSDGHLSRGATVSVWDSDEPVWLDHLRDPNGQGWHLDRSLFESRLRLCAEAAGASLVTGCGELRVVRAHGGFLVASSSGETYGAPVLVDASGRSGGVARQLGVKRRVEDELVCLYLHLPAATDDEDDCTRINVDDDGWWYSVRVPSGQRVLAFHLDADDPMSKTLRDPRRLLQKALQQPLLAAVVSDAVSSPTTPTVQMRMAGSSVLDTRELAAQRDFFAIGDASLSFDPIASQGIFHALASAFGAARAIEHGDVGARDEFVRELVSVHARYRAELRAVYGRAARTLTGTFWLRRRE